MYVATRIGLSIFRSQEKNFVNVGLLYRLEQIYILENLSYLAIFNK